MENSFNGYDEILGEKRLLQRIDRYVLDNFSAGRCGAFGHNCRLHLPEIAYLALQKKYFYVREHDVKYTL